MVKIIAKEPMTCEIFMATHFSVNVGLYVSTDSRFYVRDCVRGQDELMWFSTDPNSMANAMDESISNIVGREHITNKVIQ